MKYAQALLGLTMAALAALPAQGQAQGVNWPTQPVKIVVPFAAGGTSDVLARDLAARLQADLKQPFVVDNKGGAGGVIGADAVAKGPADGYTLLLGTIATHAINPALLPKMPYNAARDFAPVMLLGRIANVLIVPASSPLQSVKDVIAEAKAKPGTLSFATAGQGTSQHLSGETFKLLAHVDVAHVPYKGSGPAVQDVMAGQVSMGFETLTVALPQVKAGKLRVLAVTTATRNPQLPDVPTMQEAGVPGFDVASWQAFYFPAATPGPIVAKLNGELTKIMGQPEVKTKLESLGLEYTPNTPEQFAGFQATEQAKWAKVVKEGNVKAD